MKGLLPLILAVVLLVALAPPDSAEAKPCGAVTLKSGRSWIVGGAGVSCKKMRYWSKSMLRGKGRPGKRWTCHKRGRGYHRSGGCERGRKFWIYYPPD